MIDLGQNPRPSGARKWSSGGWGGIRTHEPLRVGGFQDRCLKPLGHPSGPTWVCALPRAPEERKARPSGCRKTGLPAASLCEARHPLRTVNRDLRVGRLKSACNRVGGTMSRPDLPGRKCRGEPSPASPTGAVHRGNQSSLADRGEWSVHSTGTPRAAASRSTHWRASAGEAQRRVAGLRRAAMAADTNAA